MLRTEIIDRRRSFKLPGYYSLSDVGLDGDYVSPPQISSYSLDGPVLLAYNWLDAPSAVEHREQLLECGYLRGMKFNSIVDAALAKCNLVRSEIYITQVFHLLPAKRSSSISRRHVDACFECITRHELAGRRIIALGSAAAGACRRGGIVPDSVVTHPSARISNAEKTLALASAMKAVTSHTDTRDSAQTASDYLRK
jgi:hypothetical protein